MTKRKAKAKRKTKRKTTVGKRRRYRRASIFTERLSLPLRSEMLAEIESIADATDAAVAAVARDAVAAGLPVVKRRANRNR